MNPIIKEIGHESPSYGQFLSGGMYNHWVPLSCPELFLYIITLPTVSRDEPPTLSDMYSLEMAPIVLLSSKKPAITDSATCKRKS
jgi:hypothetical protein